MSYTQLASMFTGAKNTLFYDGDTTKYTTNAGNYNNLFILDAQNDNVLDHINKKYVIDNEHEQSLENTLSTFKFRTLADKRFSQFLGKRNGLIVPGEDGELLEFRIFDSVKYRDTEGLKVEVHSLATYLDLKKAKVFDPEKTTSETAEWHARRALSGLEWQVGNVDFKGIRTLTFDNPYNPYEYLKRIAREFELELRFYITTDGSRVTGRYVDLVDRIGGWRGRTVEFGRDLKSIKRRENTNEIVTALWVYGPEKEDGTRLKVFVEDLDALERWGRNGNHLVEHYEPQTENQDITEERLRTLGKMELNKRINAIVTYEADILDLENVQGMENKKIRFGDTIRIKDLHFNPALYLEARVFRQRRDVFNKSVKTVGLGDYKEFTEDEVKAIWKQLQAEIKKKISQAELLEYTYDKMTIDDKDITVFHDGKTFAEATGIKAENNAKTYAVQQDDLLKTDIDGIDTRLNSAEITIDGLQSEINLKADRIELEGFVTADDLEVRKDIKFGGQLVGASGTFRGTVETARLIVNNPNIEQDGISGLRLQVSQWNPDLNRPFIKRGYIDFTTSNNALEIERFDENGNFVPLDGFLVSAKQSEFHGNLRVYPLTGNATPRIEFDAGRLNFSDIRWNANFGSDYGMIFRVDGTQVLTLKSNQDAVLEGRLHLKGVNFSSSLISTSTGDFALRPSGSNNVRVANSAGQWRSVLGKSFINQSDEELKKNITPYKKSALKEIMETTIYNYHFKEELDTEPQHTGVLLQEAPLDIVSIEGQGVSAYAMSSMAWKAIQEIYQILIEKGIAS